MTDQDTLANSQLQHFKITKLQLILKETKWKIAALQCSEVSYTL